MALINLMPERKPLPAVPPQNEEEVHAACAVQGWGLTITENAPTAKRRRYGYALKQPGLGGYAMTKACIGWPYKSRDEAALAAWFSAADSPGGMFLLGGKEG